MCQRFLPVPDHNQQSNYHIRHVCCHVGGHFSVTSSPSGASEAAEPLIWMNIAHWVPERFVHSRRFPFKTLNRHVKLLRPKRFPKKSIIINALKTPKNSD